MLQGRYISTIKMSLGKCPEQFCYMICETREYVLPESESTDSHTLNTHVGQTLACIEHLKEATLSSRHI